MKKLQHIFIINCINDVKSLQLELNKLIDAGWWIQEILFFDSLDKPINSEWRDFLVVAREK